MKTKINGHTFEHATVSIGVEGGTPVRFDGIKEINYDCDDTAERFGVGRREAAPVEGTGTFTVDMTSWHEMWRGLIGYAPDSKYAAHRAAWRRRKLRRVAGRLRKRLERAWARRFDVPVRNVSIRRDAAQITKHIVMAADVKSIPMTLMLGGGSPL